MNAVPNQNLTLQDLLRVFSRRRRTASQTLLVFLLLAVLLCIFIPRKYDAHGVLELQKSSADSLGLDSLMNGGVPGGGGPGDSLSANIDLQTQADILQTDALALQVIHEQCPNVISGGQSTGSTICRNVTGRNIAFESNSVCAHEGKQCED